MRKYIKLILGINIYAISINLLQALNLGMGSFDSLTLEIQQLLRIKKFGNASFVLHFIFFILLLLLLRKYKLNIKLVLISIFSVFLLTRFVNLYNLLELTIEPLIINSIWVILLLNLGLYLIASTNIIIAPFDKFIVESSKYSNIAIGKARVMCDCLLLLAVLAINQVMQNPIHISMYTLIITFATGINIYAYELMFDFFNKKKS